MNLTQEQTQQLRRAAPPLFYWLYWSCTVLIIPYLVLLWRSLGFTGSQIGLLVALRPWTAAVSGNVIVALADRFKLHRTVLVSAFLLSILCRFSMSHTTSFGMMLALAMGGELCWGPMGVIIDASVMAACEQDGDFGKKKLFASLGWGSTAPLAGLLLSRYGIQANFWCYLALAALSFPLLLLLPTERLSAKHSPMPLPDHHGQGQSADVELVLQRAGGGSSSRQDSFNTSFSARLGRGAGSQQGSFNTSCAARQGRGAGSQQGSFNTSCAAGRGRGTGSRQESFNTSSAAPYSTLSGGQQLHQGKQAQQGQQGPPLKLAGARLSPEGSLDGAPAASIRSCSQTRRAPVFEIVVNASIRQAAAGLPPQQVPWKGEPPQAEPAPSSYLSWEQQAAALPSSDSELQSVGEEELSVWQGVKHVVCTPAGACLFWLALLLGVGSGTVGYLFLFLQDLGASPRLMGLCIATNCAAEIPVFYWSGPLLERLGTMPALGVAVGAFVLRLACYVALPLLGSPWAVLPVELLQGLTLALPWAAATVHIKHVAPQAAKATTQSIFSGLYAGVGAGIGGLLGGRIYGGAGAQRLFMVACGVIAVGGAGAAVLMAWEKSFAREGEGWIPLPVDDNGEEGG